jgi:hypothetical protein
MPSKEEFPNLRPGEWHQSSEPDPKYNCIAFAAGRTDVYWWPDPFPDLLNDYWPLGLSREESVDALAELYRSFGYEPCADAGLEVGYEKVAIYANGTEPTHAARQLIDGRWISKLGPQEDIEHDNLHCLSGPCYGQPVLFLRRQTQRPQSAGNSTGA